MKTLDRDAMTSHWALKTFQEADLQLRSQAALALLEECCREALPLELHGEDGRLRRVRIAALEGARVRLELEDPGERPRPDSTLSFSFAFEERLHHFFGVALESSAQEAAGDLSFEIATPREIRSSQVRRSFRIPVERIEGLLAELEMYGAVVPVTLLDISLGGARVRLPGSPAPAPEPGARGRLRLVYGSRRLFLEVELRRQRQRIAHLRRLDAEAGGGNGRLEFMELLIALGEAWQHQR